VDSHPGQQFGLGRTGQRLHGQGQSSALGPIWFRLDVALLELSSLRSISHVRLAKSRWSLSCASERLADFKHGALVRALPTRRRGT
jgi:hypothetical protein